MKLDRRPRLLRFNTPRQIMAATFVFTHWKLSREFGHDASADFRVRAARRNYLATVEAERLRGAA